MLTPLPHSASLLSWLQGNRGDPEHGQRSYYIPRTILGLVCAYYLTLCMRMGSCGAEVSHKPYNLTPPAFGHHTILLLWVLLVLLRITQLKTPQYCTSIFMLRNTSDKNKFLGLKQGVILFLSSPCSTSARWVTQGLSHFVDDENAV